VATGLAASPSRIAVLAPQDEGAGDLLEGFGRGASLVNAGGDLWTVLDDDAAGHETFQIAGVTSLAKTAACPEIVAFRNNTKGV
jgi:hypothetical protein